MKKKQKRLVALLLSLLMVISLLPTTGLTIEAAAKPKLAKKSSSIVIGGTSKIKVKNAPKGAKITYKSAKKNIATVSKRGNVKGIKSGTTKITVSVKKNSKTTKLTYKVTVKNPKLSKSNLSLVSGKTAKLSVKNKPKKAKYTWQSSNPKVATVNKNGTVVAKAKGTANIKVKVKTAKKTYSLSCKVTVKSEPNNPETQTYTVTFNSNGGSAVTSQTVKKNGFAKQPADPTRDGYTFDGWYTAATGGQKFNFNTAIIKNITLYAHWSEVTGSGTIPTPVTTYTVTFNSNGGSPVASQTVEENARVTQPTAPTRSDYAFDGWYTAASGGQEFDFNTAITGNITLYAHWIEIMVNFGEGPFNVIFSLNDGSDSIYNRQTIEKNGIVNRPDDPEKNMYRFTGWYTEPSAITLYDFTQPIKNNITLYAGWGNPNGSDNNLYAAGESDDTIYSITDIRMDGNNVIVTLNTKSTCVLAVEFVNENDYWKIIEDETNNSETDISGKLSELNKIDSFYAQTPNHGELCEVSVTIPANSTVLDYEHYVIRAILYNENIEALCNPYYTIEYTTRYKEFDSQTYIDAVEKYGDDRTIAFDNTNENFGVLKEDVTFIEGNGETNLLTVVEIDNENDAENLIPIRTYIFNNPTSDILSLNVGNLVFAYDVNEVARLFIVKTISIDENGQVTITPDMNATLSDYYDILKVDMEGDTPDNADENIDSQLLDFNSNAKAIELIDRDVNMSTKIGGSIEYEFAKAVKFTGSLSGTVKVATKMKYDVHIFSDNYFSGSVITSVDAKLNGTVTATASNKDRVKDKWEFAKLHLTPTIPGVDIYIQPSIPLELKLQGSAKVEFSAKLQSGFNYDTNGGYSPVDKKTYDASLEADAEAECKFGPKVKLAVDVLNNAVSAEVSAQAGVKFTAKSATDISDATNEDSRHACTFCIDGNAKWFVETTGKLNYQINKKLKGTPIDVTIVSIEDNIAFPGGLQPGNFYISIINSKDSIFGGKLKFGADSCPNKTYRTTIGAIDINGNELDDVKVDIRKHGSDFAASGKTQYVKYLYDGIYTMQGDINNVTSQKTFTVSGAKQTVYLEQGANNGGIISGNVQDATSWENLSGADITVYKNSTILSDTITGNDGNFSARMPVGSYTVKISKQGYVTSIVNVDVIDAQETTLSIKLVPQTQKYGGFSGSIVDASSNEAIEGATLELREGWNNTTGNVLLTLTTDADGKYASKTIEAFGFVFGLDVGNYTLTVIKSGYQNKSFNFTIISSGIENDLGKETLLKNSRYQIFHIQMTWGDAKAYCESLGGHLATITSPEEQEVIERLVSTGSLPSYWLGATDINEEGTWIWITGEVWSYTHWDSGQPDNHSGNNGSVENYLAIRRIYNNLGMGYWNDLQYRGDSSEVPGFICEWDNVVP